MAETFGITATDVRAAFPELFGGADPPSDDHVATRITEGHRITDVSREARMYCVAHLLALDAELTGEADGGSGEVKDEQEGSERTSYVTQAKDGRQAFFTTTGYGRRLLALEGRSQKAAVAILFA